MTTLTISIVALTLASTVNAQQARPDVAIQAVVTALIEAQRTFDVPALEKLLAPDYVEISPVGEVDPRAKVLTFYAPDKKVADAPKASLDEMTTRVYGDTAVTIARLTFQMTGPNGAPMSRSMRCVFVTRSTAPPGNTARQWLLVSAQYTPIRN